MKGIEQILLLANNPAVGDSALEDIVEIATNFPFSGFVNPVYLEVSSASANDAQGGTGARQVQITGLDVDSNPIEEYLNLNGTYDVKSVKQYRRINSMKVTAAGSSGNNEGIITLKIFGDADDPAVSIGAVISPDTLALESGVTDALSVQIEDTSTSLNETINVTFTGLALATAGVQDVTFGGVVNGATSTGLANDATAYTATINPDGAGAQAISVVGSAAQTIADLLNELNADTTAATWTFDDANDKYICTSDTVSTSSTIVILDTDLFSTLTAGGGATIQSAVDGLNSDDATVVSQINTAISANATILANYPVYVAAAIYTGGGDINKIYITSPEVGADSTLTIGGTANGVLSLATPVSGSDGADGDEAVNIQIAIGVARNGIFSVPNGYTATILNMVLSGGSTTNPLEVSVYTININGVLVLKDTVICDRTIEFKETSIVVEEKIDIILKGQNLGTGNIRGTVTLRISLLKNR